MANKVEGTAGAQSQLQSTSAEPEQQAKKPDEKKRNTAEVGGEGTEVQFFDGTVAKINADGDEVMSDHVGPGEKLVRAVREEEAEAQAEERRKANERNANR